MIMKSFYIFLRSIFNYLYNLILIMLYNFNVKKFVSEMLIQLFILKQKELAIDGFFMILYVYNKYLQNKIYIISINV